MRTQPAEIETLNRVAGKVFVCMLGIAQVLRPEQPIARRSKNELSFFHTQVVELYVIPLRAQGKHSVRVRCIVDD